MKIKRLKKIKINSFTFAIKWTNKHDGGSFDYSKREIEIGTRGNHEDTILQVLTHELFEICALDVGVRYNRRDVSDDYYFVYDHRQHDLIMNMFSGLLAKFI